MPTGVYPRKPLSEETKAKLRLARIAYPLPTKAELEELYYHKGLSGREIACLLNIPAPSVFIFLNRNGLQLRTHSEVQRLHFRKHPEDRQILSARAVKQFTGQKQSAERIRNRIEARRGYRHSKETRYKISQGTKGKTWPPQYRERMLRVVMANRQKRPTKLERDLQEILDRYRLPYKYVGDGYTWIAGRCPDFLNVNGEKIVIEVFSRWWHDPILNKKVEPRYTEENTLMHYANYGFKCVIIWEDELKNEAEVLGRLSLSRAETGRS